ncbi:MAG: hypothetical protein GY710_09235 [Desulfobacteraceae bacterium]|nr:hypothetical protein [Desulfobacteraceae bacterium]
MFMIKTVRKIVFLTIFVLFFLSQLSILGFAATDFGENADGVLDAVINGAVDISSYESDLITYSEVKQNLGQTGALVDGNNVTTTRWCWDVMDVYSSTFYTETAPLPNLKPSKITIHANNWHLKGMAVEYNYDNGNIFKIGDQNSAKKKVLELADDEYINKITAGIKYNSTFHLAGDNWKGVQTVRYLLITTNKGNTLEYGSPGSKTIKTVTAGNDEHIASFCGGVVYNQNKSLTGNNAAITHFRPIIKKRADIEFIGTYLDTDNITHSDPLISSRWFAMKGNSDGPTHEPFSVNHEYRHIDSLGWSTSETVAQPLTNGWEIGMSVEKTVNSGILKGKVTLSGKYSGSVSDTISNTTGESGSVSTWTTLGITDTMYVGTDQIRVFDSQAYFYDTQLPTISYFVNNETGVYYALSGEVSMALLGNSFSKSKTIGYYNDDSLAILINEDYMQEFVYSFGYVPLLDYDNNGIIDSEE